MSSLRVLPPRQAFFMAFLFGFTFATFFIAFATFMAFIVFIDLFLSFIGHDSGCHGHEENRNGAGFIVYENTEDNC